MEWFEPWSTFETMGREISQSVIIQINATEKYNSFTVGMLPLIHVQGVCIF